MSGERAWLTNDEQDILRDWWDEDTTVGVESAFPIISRILAARAAAVLYDARDALYRGEGPDIYADADITYGEWLGNRADRLTPPP